MSFKEKLAPAGLWLKDNAPSIGVGLGLSLILGGTVVACIKTAGNDDTPGIRDTVGMHKATRKWHEDAIDNEVNAADLQDRPVDKELIERHEKDISKDYLWLAWDITKLYALPAGMIFVGTGLVFKSYTSVQMRLAEMTLGYERLHTAYTVLSDRVAAKYGEDALRDLQTGESAKEVNSDPMNESHDYSETGAFGQGDISAVEVSGNPYAYWFGPYYPNGEINPNYQEDIEAMVFWVESRLKYLESELRIKGHIFLNEALDACRLPPVPEGWKVGWIWDPESSLAHNHIAYKIGQYIIENDNGDETISADCSLFASPDDDVRLLITFEPDVGCIDKTVYWRNRTSNVDPNKAKAKGHIIL